MKESETEAEILAHDSEEEWGEASENHPFQ